jgi:hypothetical protein
VLEGIVGGAIDKGELCCMKVLFMWPVLLCMQLLNT